MFTVTGRINGRIDAITWDDGKLSGTPSLVEYVQARAQVYEGTRTLGPVEGPTTRRRHLQSGLSTLFLLFELFEPDAQATGDVPSRPPIPVGAIG